MTDYTITTNFGAKDSLPSGNAGKVIKGSEFTTEFTNIQSAINSKADSSGDTFTGVVNFNADVAVNTSTLFVDVSTNRVGVATNTPTTALDVNGAITATSLDISGDIDVDGITNLDVVDIDGAVDFASTTSHAGDSSFGDNVKAKFGASNDLEIYHDGSHSYIADTGTGRLNVNTNIFRVSNAAGDEISANFVQDGAVSLYHDGVKKLETLATGVDVTGKLTADELEVDGVGALSYTDVNNLTSTTDGDEDFSYSIPAGHAVVNVVGTTDSFNIDFIKNIKNDGCTINRTDAGQSGSISFSLRVWHAKI